jgi:hypothetical protein
LPSTLLTARRASSNFGRQYFSSWPCKSVGPVDFDSSLAVAVLTLVVTVEPTVAPGVTLVTTGTLSLVSLSTAERTRHCQTEKALRGTRSDSPTDRRPTVLRRDGAGVIRLSRTNREISGRTADSGTETEEARSMASRPSRDSPGQYLRIRIVGMSYILIVREIDDPMRGAERLEFEISWLMQTQGSIRLR